MMWVTASKKKNFETTNVPTSMAMLAAAAAMRPMMFMTRMMLRTTYPGPARERLKRGIFDNGFERRLIARDLVSGLVIFARTRIDSKR